MTFERWLQIHGQKRKEGNPLRMGQRFINEFHCSNESDFPGLWEASEGKAEGLIRDLLIQWQYYPNMPEMREG